MFDKELMKQLATIPTQNREEWFAERDKLETLAVEMTRINAKDMVQKYGIARVLRVLAATIKQNPKDYDADVVEMARALIADPELPSKVMEGRDDEIVRCLRCFVCMAERPTTGTRRCTVNPQIGREQDLPPLPVRRVKKPGRNDPCPCGKLRPNGLPMKYKDCCGKNA